MEDKPIYPNVRINDNGYKTLIESFLRVKHTDGKWYLVHFREIINNRSGTDKYIYVDRFHTYVYLFQIKGIITPGVKISDGVGGSKLIHPLDENQEDEAERLTRIMGI
jgi:hypothetical protein